MLTLLLLQASQELLWMSMVQAPDLRGLLETRVRHHLWSATRGRDTLHGADANVPVSPPSSHVARCESAHGQMSAHSWK